MRRMSNRFGTVGIFLMVVAALFLFSGCTALKSKEATPPSGSPDEPAPARTIYYDFGDVLLPTELKINKKDSFVFRTPGMTAGVLSLSGRVEINSLINFFENNLNNDIYYTVCP